jgi:proteasome beta subunit
MPGGFIAHRKGKKVYKIDDHLGMTISGVVADAQNVVDILKYYAGIYKLEKKTPIPVKSAARLASNVFFSSRLFPYIADVLVGGYDDTGASIFNVDLFGSLNKENYVSTGSGSPIAYGILESEYKDDLTLEKGILIAVKAVTSAMKRDAMSGDSFDVVIINKEGYKELSEEEKKKLLTEIFG